jgi:hypothetical protein
MFDLWKEDLTPEETDELLNKAAEVIRKRKLELPAMLFFESHKPLAFVGANTAVTFAPFLVPFLGFDNVNNYSRLFSKRENIEELLNRLDQKEGEGKEGSEV